MTKQDIAPLHIYINTNQSENQDLKFYNAMKAAHKKANAAIERFYKNDEIAKHTEKGARLAECANYISYKHYFITDEYKLEHINLCRDRLCLNCQLALSRKLIRQLVWSIEHLQMNHGDTLQFLTLTAPNVQAHDLRTQIQTLNKAVKSFLRKYDIKDYFRSTEITYNKNNKTYHPHFHILMIAPESTNFPLFDKTMGKYGANALQFAWAAKWQEISGKKLTTISGNGKAYLEATIYEVHDKRSIFELTKYVTKPTDITEPVIKALYGRSIDETGTTNTGIAGLRLKTPCGQFKDLANRYKICAEIERQAEKELYSQLDYELLEYLYKDNAYRQVRR